MVAELVGFDGACFSGSVHVQRNFVPHGTRALCRSSWRVL